MAPLSWWWWRGVCWESRWDQPWQKSSWEFFLGVVKWCFWLILSIFYRGLFLSWMRVQILWMPFSGSYSTHLCLFDDLELSCQIETKLQFPLGCLPRKDVSVLKAASRDTPDQFGLKSIGAKPFLVEDKGATRERGETLKQYCMQIISLHTDCTLSHWQYPWWEKTDILFSCHHCT